MLLYAIFTIIVSDEDEKRHRRGPGCSLDSLTAAPQAAHLFLPAVIDVSFSTKRFPCGISTFLLFGSKTRGTVTDTNPHLKVNILEAFTAVLGGTDENRRIKTIQNPLGESGRGANPPRDAAFHPE